MAEPVRCRNCKQELPTNALMGLCPLCLLTQGLDIETLSLSHRGEPGVTARWSEEVSHRSVLEVLKSVIGEVPSVLLRDTQTELESPVVRPSSPEMPADRGRYQLLGEIGKGGMGSVFKGRDPDLGRDLAVKILLEEHQDTPDLVRRFVEEAQIGGQLQHPGIVPVYELGAFSRPPALLHHEAGQGTHPRDLAERSRGPRARPAAVPGASSRQVCQTMAYAHARGVIHRDLKPSNVMVGAFGEVQVMDWGLAKVLPKDGPKKDVVRRPANETVVATRRGARAKAISRRPAWCWARRPTWPPSRPGARRKPSTAGPTCSRWARSSARS